MPVVEEKIYDKDGKVIGTIQSYKWDNVWRNIQWPVNTFKQEVSNIVNASGTNILGPTKPANWNQFVEDTSGKAAADYPKIMKPIITQALEEYERQKKAQDNRWSNRLKRYTVNVTSGLFWVL